MILSVNVYDWWTTAINTPGVKTILVFILLSAVEVSPVKINPWSWFGGLVGKMLGVKALGDKMDALEKKVDENQAITIRVRILRFEDELQLGKEHSKDAWDQVMDDIRRYELYTKEHPEFKNNITVASTQHILHKYSELLEKRAWTAHLSKEDW